MIGARRLSRARGAYPRGAEGAPVPSSDAVPPPKAGAAHTGDETALGMLNNRKQPSNLLEEGTRPERLGEDRTRYIPVCGNARNEQYSRGRLEAGKLGGEFHAVHHRQEDVGHDKAESPFQRAGDSPGLFAVLSRKDSEPLVNQGPPLRYRGALRRPLPATPSADATAPES